MVCMVDRFQLYADIIATFSLLEGLLKMALPFYSLLCLLDGTRAAIGQFSGRYFTVLLAKNKTLFSRALFQDK